METSIYIIIKINNYDIDYMYFLKLILTIRDIKQFNDCEWTVL